MKDWTDTQRVFIRAHLNIDMTAAELARLFHVTDTDIWQLARARRWHYPGYGKSQPMGHDEFQRLYRPPGYVRP